MTDQKVAADFQTVPDMQIFRIRLSDKTSRLHPRHCASDALAKHLNRISRSFCEQRPQSKLAPLLNSRQAPERQDCSVKRNPSQMQRLSN